MKDKTKPHCCKNPNLRASFNIWLSGVPFSLDAQDGPQCDDTKAEYSEGWDFVQQDEAYCGTCKARFKIEQDNGYKLRQTSPAKAVA